MVERLHICEVSPRDGLQNEKAHITMAQKMMLVNALAAVGLEYVELTSFVNPKAVPQMSDADTVMSSALAQFPDIRFTSLVLNDKGYERAVSAGCRKIALVLVLSDSLSQRNNGISTQESFNIYKQLLARAQRESVWVRVYLAVSWVCPYEGATPVDKVLRYADALWEIGVDELALADSIGHAHPLEVGRLCEQIGKRLGIEKLAVHLHDTQALGLANAAAAIQAGIRIIDSSVGGLGGCPFAPGSAGNLATEDLVFMAHKMGFETGVKEEKLFEMLPMIETMVGRPVGGRIRQWWDNRQTVKG